MRTIVYIIFENNGKGGDSMPHRLKIETSSMSLHIMAMTCKDMEVVSIFKPFRILLPPFLLIYK